MTEAEICIQIEAKMREYWFAVVQRVAADNRTVRFVSTSLGYKATLPKSERDKIGKQAAKFIALGAKIAKREMALNRQFKSPAKLRKNVQISGENDPKFVALKRIIVQSHNAQATWVALEAKLEKECSTLAQQLPVAAWWRENVFKDGFKSLAIIIGEAGNLADYPLTGNQRRGPSCLWKRLGLAVFHDESGHGLCQGRTFAGLSRDERTAAWIERGYSPRRRARIFTIGDSLIKKRGPWRDLYLARKKFEIAKAKDAGLEVLPAAIAKKKKDQAISQMHIHRRAQRYVEKRLLRALWQEWRRCGQTRHADNGLAISTLPHAAIPIAAEHHAAE